MRRPSAKASLNDASPACCTSPGGAAAFVGSSELALSDDEPGEGGYFEAVNLDGGGSTTIAVPAEAYGRFLSLLDSEKAELNRYRGFGVA